MEIEPEICRLHYSIAYTVFRDGTDPSPIVPCPRVFPRTFFRVVAPRA